MIHKKIFQISLLLTFGLSFSPTLINADENCNGCTCPGFKNNCTKVMNAVCPVLYPTSIPKAQQFLSNCEYKTEGESNACHANCPNLPNQPQKVLTLIWAKE
jgi:hypothetical protein